MIASLLPGLRDLRVPLAAGALWLVVLWLMFYQLVPTKNEATGLAAEVYRLAGAFGPGVLAATISFIAYLIGILVVPLTVGPTSYIALVARGLRDDRTRIRTARQSYFAHR